MTTKELLERIDARLEQHEAFVNANPMQVVPVNDVPDFDLLWDAGMVVWIDDMPVVVVPV